MNEEAMSGRVAFRMKAVRLSVACFPSTYSQTLLSALQIGGYLTQYDGLSFLTIRSAGHQVLPFEILCCNVIYSKLLELEMYMDAYECLSSVGKVWSEEKKVLTKCSTSRYLQLRQRRHTPSSQLGYREL